MGLAATGCVLGEKSTRQGGTDEHGQLNSVSSPNDRAGIPESYLSTRHPTGTRKARKTLVSGLYLLFFIRTAM